MIGYVNRKQETNFKDNRLHPKLRAIVLLACSYCYYKFGERLFVTSTYRESDKGVHGLWRGVDIDNDSLGHEKLREIETYVNWLFMYDPERPKFKVCLYHTVNVDKTKGWHLHFQVHPNTIMSEPAI